MRNDSKGNEVHVPESEFGMNTMGHQIRSLFVIDSLGVGGAERSLLNTIQASTKIEPHIAFLFSRSGLEEVIPDNITLACFCRKKCEHLRQWRL